MQDQTIFQTENRTIFQSILFKIEESTINSRAGIQRVHKSVYRLPTVDIFRLTQDNEVSLVNEYRPFFDTHFISAPADFMDKPHETPLKAGKRELHEEVDIRAQQWKLLSTVEIGSSVIKATEYVFLAQDLEFADAQLEDDEEISLIKMTISEDV